MSDFKEQLLSVIAAKMITENHLEYIKLPEGFGKIKWTGWKESWNEIAPHAQLLWVMDPRPGKDRLAYYVDLPSMNHGGVKLGGALNIEFNPEGHYLTEHTTAAEIREWFKEGFNLLIDDVLNDNPWLLENPLHSKG